VAEVVTIRFPKGLYVVVREYRKVIIRFPFLVIYREPVIELLEGLQDIGPGVAGWRSNATKKRISISKSAPDKARLFTIKIRCISRVVWGRHKRGSLVPQIVPVDSSKEGVFFKVRGLEPLLGVGVQEGSDEVLGMGWDVIGPNDPYSNCVFICGLGKSRKIKIIKK